MLASKSRRAREKRRGWGETCGSLAFLPFQPPKQLLASWEEDGRGNSGTSAAKTTCDVLLDVHESKGLGQDS